MQFKLSTRKPINGNKTCFGNTTNERRYFDLKAFQRSNYLGMMSSTLRVSSSMGLVVFPLKKLSVKLKYTRDSQNRCTRQRHSYMGCVGCYTPGHGEDFLESGQDDT